MALEEIRKARLKKLENLKKAGIDPYPAESFRSRSVKEAIDGFEEFSESKEKLTLAGRLMSCREHGGSTFGDLKDETGQLQLFFKKDALGEKDYRLFCENFDIGDFIEAAGPLIRTKTGEPTLEVQSLRMLTKTLLPLPEKWHGLQDVEERFRKRYLDFLFNKEVKDKFKIRVRLIQEIRKFMDSEGFIEVETPVLQVLAGGASARPFKTFINALDMEVYLRIAPELFLKRLLIGGFEKVYEVGKNFRNEGIDRDHNPEFTEVEFYAAYKDYQWLMEFTEKMFENVVGNILGKTRINYKDNEIDFKGSYKKIEFNDLFMEYSGLDYDSSNEDDLIKKVRELDIKTEKEMTKGNIADEIYKKVARPNIIQPTFVINHPIEISPLSKRLEEKPDYVARMQLIAGGQELINSYSELNDPVDQKNRFNEQQEIAKRGDREAHPFDDEFIEALEYGMPPAAGWGLGVDRLVALLTSSHAIREVILFPLMKPRD